MKKEIYLVLMFLTFMSFSCEKDEDNAVATTIQNHPELLGTWKFDYAMPIRNVVEAGPIYCGDGFHYTGHPPSYYVYSGCTTLIFNQDNTVIIRNESNISESTYDFQSFGGGYINLSKEGITEIQYNNVVFDDQYLIMNELGNQQLIHFKYYLKKQ